MEKEKSLIERRNDRKGIRRILNNVIEIMKSKVSKYYILSENSPEILRRNKDLILKTIKINAKYLDQVPEDILLEELFQQQLPINGIIDTAFKHGYTFDKSSSDILISEYAKTAILQYIEIQKENTKKGDSIGQNGSNVQWKLSYLLENLDESLLLDMKFRKQLLDLVIEKGYKITQFSPAYLKQNGILAENYYKNLLKNDRDDLLNANILSPELLKDRSFLQNYIKLLVQEGIDNATIISTLTHNKECFNTLKNNLELFQILFEQITPTNLESFFSKFFSDEELKKLLANRDKLHGKLLKISQLYAKDSTILQSLNGKLLDEQYQNIPNYKMQLIAKKTEFQSKILGLNNYEYILYTKMTQVVAQKTDRWNRFEQNIVENLSNGYYGELISDLYEQAQQGNKITAKDIETLTLLLSKQCSSKSFFDGYLTNIYRSQGMDERAIKQEEAIYSNNVFNITNKNELENFEKIKELVCDTILANSSLDDESLTSSISKHLEKFRQLSEIDRIKLALLEKYYNMDLREAANIVNVFSNDIDSIPFNNEYQASIIEQLKAIKNIFKCDNIDILKQIDSLGILVQTDLSSSTYLIEQAKEMFEQLYKESLYMPKEEDRIGNVTYNGKKIEIFNANTNFSMIVKRIGVNANDSQEVWNSMTKDGEYGRKDLRYYTCTSYMTDENLLKSYSDNEVILGFAQGIQSYSFDAIYPQDAHTPFVGGDSIYNDLNSSYMIPSTLEMNTDNNYNEVVVNTLGIDGQGQITKLQPDYIIYIKNQREIENFEADPMWEKSKRVASEFGIPIVVIDKERIKESEKMKIANMAEKLKGRTSNDEILRFTKKVEHYICRYGVESILEYIPKGKIDLLREYIERSEVEGTVRSREEGR